MNKQFDKNYLPAFFLPIIILILGYCFVGVFPFGEKSVLVSDLAQQYIDITAYAVNSIKGGNGLGYSWSGGLGSNIYAICCYLLFSPFNLLFFFFDESLFQEVYLIVILLKIGFVGLCFYTFFKKSKMLGSDGGWGLVFSLLYSLGIFSIRATMNPMWLENIALLPLVLLGVERIIEKKRITLFAVTYALCVITNYYMAYISGIFSFLYFIWYSAANNKCLRDSLKSFLFFLLATAAALLLSGFVIVPTYHCVFGNYTRVFNQGNTNDEIHTVKNLLYTLLSIINERTTSGIANSFLGCLGLLFGILYFLNSRISVKEKIASGIILFIIFASMVIKLLYLMWHFFRAPTGFDGRFLFVGNLLWLVIAARAIENIEGINKKLCFVPAVVYFAASNIAIHGRFNGFDLICALGVLALMIVYICLIKRDKLKIIRLLAMAECAVVAVMAVIIIDNNDVYSYRSSYVQAVREIKSDVQECDYLKDEYARCEIGRYNSINYPLLLGYNGVMSYSSLANQKSFEFFEGLGLLSLYDNKVNLTSSNTTALNSFLGVKYQLVNKNEPVKDSAGRELIGNSSININPLYEFIEKKDNIYAYENSLVFPIAFCANKETLEFKTDEGASGFENQNSLFKSFGATDEAIFEEYSFDSVNGYNVDAAEGENGSQRAILNKLEEGRSIALEEDEKGKLCFEYEAKQAGEYYTCIKTLDSDNTVVTNKYDLYVNGIRKDFYSLKDEIIGLGYYQKGDKIEIWLHSVMDFDFYIPALYRFNSEEFKRLSDSIEGIKLTEVNGMLVGEFDFDEKKNILTTLSFDEGLVVKVDGLEIEAKRSEGGLLWFALPEKTGTLEISYKVRGMRLGGALSLIGILLALGLKMVGKIKKA